MLSCQCGKIFEEFKARAKLSPDEEVVLQCPACRRWSDKDHLVWVGGKPQKIADDDDMGWGEIYEEPETPEWNRGPWKQH